MTSRCAAVKIVLMKIWKKDPWLVSIDRNTFHKKEKIENEKVQNSFEQQKYQIIFKNGLSNYFFQCKAATSTDVLKQIPEGLHLLVTPYGGEVSSFKAAVKACFSQNSNHAHVWFRQQKSWIIANTMICNFQVDLQLIVRFFATKIRVSFTSYFSSDWRSYGL